MTAWLCPYCHSAASGKDETIVDQDQARETERGLIALGPDLTPDRDGCEELSRRCCDCCGTRRQGTFHRYVVHTSE